MGFSFWVSVEQTGSASGSSLMVRPLQPRVNAAVLSQRRAAELLVSE
jgi:hypothetical protein